MKKIIAMFLVVASAFSALCLCSCNNGNVNDTEYKINIAVSIVPQVTFVKAVVGDDADIGVTAAIPAGFSPETYEPTAKEMRLLDDADVYFGIGVQAEGNNILPFLGKSVVFVALDKAVAGKYTDLKIGTERDPHIWLSPKRVVVMVETVRDKLCELYPDKAKSFTENAQAYILKLNELDAKVTATLDNITHKKFIAFHPAFGYFADDYGLTMYALEEEGKEATSAHLREMIDFAKTEGIRAVFYQAEVDSSQSRSFAESIGGKTVMLSPLSESYIENIETMANLIAEVGA